MKLVSTIFVCLLIMVLASYLEFQIPMPGGLASIPITGQTLAVCLISLSCQRTLGFVIIGSYLLLGAIGLPIFAGGEAGWSHLTGKTSGYLWAFLLIPILFGVGRNGTLWLSSSWRILVANLFSTALILCSGALVLSSFIGLSAAVKYGMLPFLIGGVIKSILATLIIVWLRRRDVIPIRP